MFDLHSSDLSYYDGSQAHRPRESAGVRCMRQAARAYERAVWDAQLRSIWCALTRQPNRLHDLAEAKRQCVTGSARPGGLQTVAIDRILGSEGRSRDFDGRFLPLRKCSRERWISIAAAQLMDVPLPPVSLIQVGDRFYVRDGHHRVSVARALGQQYIEADITVWELAVESRPAGVPALTPLPVL
jgi:hypothetical protein